MHGHRPSSALSMLRDQRIAACKGMLLPTLLPHDNLHPGLGSLGVMFSCMLSIFSCMDGDILFANQDACVGRSAICAVWTYVQDGLPVLAMLLSWSAMCMLVCRLLSDVLCDLTRPV